MALCMTSCSREYSSACSMEFAARGRVGIVWLDNGIMGNDQNTKAHHFPFGVCDGLNKLKVPIYILNAKFGWQKRS